MSRDEHTAIHRHEDTGDYRVAGRDYESYGDALDALEEFMLSYDSEVERRRDAGLDRIVTEEW
jgi:hypothetical protein